MSAREIILHLSLIKGVGPALIQRIIACKPQTISWDALYAFSAHDWQVTFGASLTLSQLLAAGLKERSSLEKELEILAHHGIQWATLIDDTFPKQLSEIHVPPAVLFWMGDISFTRAIAIVGSRGANSYGEYHIRAIVPELVRHGFCIVSGGALGADTMAHEATLSARGKTIVVLGSGLLHFAPRTNRQLFEACIERGGAVVSSFPCNTIPQPIHFPARNRVISGLSQGIVVAQAASKSGARITAQFALEQGRDVFAIPGSLEDPLSAGCHGLIQEGAKLITGASDILEEYGIGQLAQAEGQSAIPFDNLNKKGHTDKDEKMAQNEGSFVHQMILKSCVTAQSIDALALACGVSLPDMQEELFSLQMAGKIEQDFTGMWKVI